MTRILTISVLSVVFCIVSGCAYWHKEGTSFNQCDDDLQQCYKSLEKYADMGAITNYEVGFIKDCMEQKGYKLHLEPCLPKYVKRRDPRVDTFWLLAGVSGTVEE